jgi:hypothetical protein
LRIAVHLSARALKELELRLSVFLISAGLAARLSPC